MKLTVKDLIELLQKQPLDYEITLEDTEWDSNAINIYKDDKCKDIVFTIYDRTDGIEIYHYK